MQFQRICFDYSVIYILVDIHCTEILGYHPAKDIETVHCKFLRKLTVLEKAQT